MTNVDLTPRETSWFRWLPGLALLRSYQPSWLPRDLIAGLVLISVADFVPVAIGGCAVALVSFADTSVLSRTYAARTGSRVDPNQEMVGLGAANLAAGLFQGFPVSSSSSRTPIAEAAGSRTQLTGVVGALAVVLILLWASNLLKYVPTAALAGVVISSAIGLIEVNDLRDALSELNESLRAMGVKLAFAELKDPVKDKLKRFGIFDQFGEGFFFATIGAAVDAYQGER
jgi:MFS superfamily sulfate permease-like transporter